MILEDFERPQSIAEEQGSTEKGVNWYIQMV